MASDDDLQVLVGLDPVPLTAAEAAAALGITVDEVFGAADRLVASGAIRESGHGWVTQGPPVAPAGPRRAHLAGRLADALQDDGRKGRLLVIAGRGAEGIPLLVSAGRAGDAAAATAALEVGGLDPADAAALHLALASHHRAAGNSPEALDHARRAVPLLEGAAQADALGFVAQVSDDLGHPHEAATWATLAAGRAAHNGDPAKQGSLLTLAARSLSRLGFVAEAEAASITGRGLVEAHGSPAQRARARLNRAWVLLDHGFVSDAAEAFASVRDLASHLGGEAEVAASLASEGRALLRAGRSAEGLALVREAFERAGDAPAPALLAHLGLAEAAIHHRLADTAVEAASAADDLARRHLPALRDITLLAVARARRSAGDTEGAATALAEATTDLEPGINGLRIRLRCELERLAQLPAGERWPKQLAEDLTDSLLQARWLEPAVELMILRERHHKGTDVGLQATSLAVRIGNPMLAAEAAEVSSAWRRPEGAAAAVLVKRTDALVADEWREAWGSAPGVGQALALEDSEEAGDAGARLDAALLRAGLADDVLSPAQRRSGNIRHQTRRTLRGWIAPAAAVMALVVASAALAIGLRPDPEPAASDTTTTAPTTTASTLPIVACNQSWPGGTHTYRAGPAGTGSSSEGGIAETAGYCWEPARFSGDTRTSPVAWGAAAFVTSSTRDQIIRIDQAAGIINTGWPADTGGRLLTAIGVGTVGVESGSTAYVVWVPEDGRVRVRTESGTAAWAPTNEVDLPGRSPGGLIVDQGAIYVGRVSGGEGYVAALDLGSGQVTWDTRESIPEMGPVNATVSVHDGLLYVVDDTGVLWMLDTGTGEPVCPGGVRLPSISGPGRVAVEGDLVVVPGDNSVVFGKPGDCGLAAWTPTLWEPDEGTEVALADGVVYFVTSGGLMAWAPADTVPGDPQSGVRWPIVNPTRGGLGAGQTDRWSTSPVVAGGMVLIGSREGELIAVDVTDGSVVWAWELHGDGAVVGEVVPLKEGVLAITEDGTLHLIGGPRAAG